MAVRSPGYAHQDLILACHEERCAWDHRAPWYVTYNRYGQRIWEKVQPCLRGCGSTRRKRCTSDGTFTRIGQPKYTRPDGWYDEPQYFSQATRARILWQQQTIGFEEVIPEGMEIEDDNVVALRKRGA